MSRVTVRIPYALRPFTKGKPQIIVNAVTLRDALSTIERSYPGISARVLTPEGTIRSNVNLFVNETSARDLDGLSTLLGEGEVVSIIPAVAGGGPWCSYSVRRRSNCKPPKTSASNPNPWVNARLHDIPSSK